MTIADIHKMHTIFDTLHAGINILDRQGTIVYVNKAYCDMHDYSSDQLIGRSFDMVLQQSDGLDHYRKIMAGEVERPFVLESVNRKRDNSVIPVLISWNYIYNGKDMDGMITVIQDISDIKEYEKRLKESEQKYRALVETISDIIWEIDSEGNYTYISRKCYPLFDYHPEQLLYTGIWELFKDVEDPNSQAFLQAIQNREPFTPLELTKRGQDGRTVIVESSGVPLFDNEGNFSGYRGVDRDITAQKQVKFMGSEMDRLKNNLKQREYLEYTMGDSPVIRSVHKSVEKIARTDFSVFISGETGSGKELIANAIHDLSDRSEKQMISIDCGSITESLFESELFGHTRGAFTGSTSEKRGLLQKANGGTLFLDEITNLSTEMQKKLLRVLQEKEVQPVGSTEKERLDIRFIAATNENLSSMIKNGSFREDLYYRLNEFSISLPPLRARREDIPHLVKKMLIEIAQSLQTYEKRVSSEAMDWLVNQHWEGNVRQLKNRLKRAFVISDRDILEKEHFHEENSPVGLFSAPAVDPKLQASLDGIEMFDLKQGTRNLTINFERHVIGSALLKFKGNKSKTARFLQLDYKTLFNKIKTYNL
jgi:PAS domain S-box-containing protein